jgi:hypothetical protein
MLISHLPAVTETSAQAALVSPCPYRNATSMYCSASIIKLAISKRRNTAYCSTENFDCCSVFLGKVLRGTRNFPLQ